MPNAAFKGRWTPLPNEAAQNLIARGQHAALAIWLTLLRFATEQKTWTVAASTSTLMRQTNLSKNSVARARQELIDEGYIEIVDGGGDTRKKTVYGLTQIEIYAGTKQVNGEAKTEDWTL